MYTRVELLAKLVNDQVFSNSQYIVKMRYTVLERMATLSSNLTELFANYVVNFYKHRIFRIKKRILSK